MILLAVDPSLRSTGVALFRDDALLAVGRIRSELHADHSSAARAAAMSYQIRDWYLTRVAAGMLAGQAHSELTIAVEWPQVYRAVKSKGDPNDLFGLAGVCTGVIVALRPHASRAYLPADWEPAPKVSPERKRRGLGPIDSEAFTSPRGVRILSRLSEAERALVPQSHDAVDSVGIGLHHLGRLATRRVFHGASPG